MTPSLRVLTVLLVLVYFFAAAVHAGLLPAVGGPLGFAPVVEAALGVVMLATLAGLIRSALTGYAIAAAGTLFGFAIVLARGLGGFDLGAHLVMLVGVGIGFALIRAQRSTRSL
jgi:hypothetical protein